MFNDFKAAVHKQFEAMSNGELFETQVNKEEIWDTYLSSFPEGTNTKFRERLEYDCQHCKQFIRACGNVVAIEDGKLVSIWDIDVGGYYQVVADALAALVKSRQITSVFRHPEKNLGVDFNVQLLDNGETIKWAHFYYQLPSKFVSTSGSDLSKLNTNKVVFMRGLTEISLDAAEMVIELIEQDSLYRGFEHKSVIEMFIELKKEFNKIARDAKDIYCWYKSVTLGQGAKIRNTVIGTLLVDISDGKPLDVAVAAFESKVAPTNYKRSSALVTKSMINNAQKKVEELGIESALSRRYAVIEDITVNNVLWADRSAKKAMNVFEELIEAVPTQIDKLTKVEEVDIETFIQVILPKADCIEVIPENRHINNLMSLIAPKHVDAATIFKWDNGFSWSYNGEVADSIKERVKQAGGNINGVLRCSLSWFNYDDLDIHVREPDGNHIFYSRKQSPRTSGSLDVDMNIGSNESRNAVENIVWTEKSKMSEGIYELFVHNYTPRETIDNGFDIEIEYDGVIHSFYYDKRVVKNVPVAKFEFYRETGIKFIESLPASTSSKEVWGINTNKLQKVSVVMNSPNYWDDHAVGNKQFFFILEGCKNDKQTRGFYNEFLDNRLMEHRKVFEVLGSKMKTEKSDRQLSGIGFSSTQHDSILCKVSGSFTRTIKINI